MRLYSQQIATILFFYISSISYGFDGSKISKIIIQDEYWKILEINLPSGKLYRLATDSTNQKETHLTFDFTKGCTAEPAVMIKNLNHYIPPLLGGLVLEYKVENQFQRQEFVSRQMSMGDKWGFFLFRELLLENLLESNEKSRLAIWVPKGSDGNSKRSGSFFFSLKGLKGIYSKAKEFCLADQ